MRKSLFSIVLVIGTGFVNVAHALSIDPKSVNAVVENQIYRGGTTGGGYGTPVDDFDYACKSGFTMVVNAYSNFDAQQIQCADGRFITYIGDHWKTPKAGRDDVVVAEVRRNGKVLVHCRYGVDASQEVAYIIAARSGIMPVQEAADRFLHGKAGTPHQPMVPNILSRGQ
jgi:hypothetical protein